MMNDSPLIRILLVDDHMMVRRGLATFLQIFDDLELVGEAPDGETALLLCVEAQPDVVLMDMMMPRMGGVAATRLLRERFPEIQVIALTSFREQKLVQEALQAGAISYLLKDISAEKLATAIREAHGGHSTLSPEVTQALVEATSQPPAVGHDLTERDQEVLILLVRGLNNSEIAELALILPNLSNEIIVPNAVWQEIMDGSHFDRATEVLPQLDGLQRRNVYPVADAVQWNLGAGETDVLSFAARHRDYVAVLDDMLAKKYAKSLGLPTLGTGSILILAKEQGLIESVSQSLAILQQVGLWVSGAIVQILLKQTGE